MSIFSDNLRHLRESRKESQQQTADNLEIKRGRYEPWESGKSEPPYDMLIKISQRYGISIDLMLSVDLRKYKIDELVTLEDNRIVLPILVDSNGDNLIEIVTHKAKAGYAAGGYADFTFISELDHISLPWLSRNEKYRTFPVEGDSMPPHNNDSFIVGKYIEKLGDVVDGRTYIVITKNAEIIYKRLNKNGENTFMLKSDNTFYEPYDVKFSDIAEIWEYAGSIERGVFKQIENNKQPLEEVIRNLQLDLMEIRRKVS